MAKIELDKYYTPIELDKYYTPIEVANHCWEIIERYVNFSIMKRIIEPSVGGGAFCNWIILRHFINLICKKV